VVLKSISLKSQLFTFSLGRAYVVHAQPARLTTAESKIAFEESVAKWVESQVARHKYLRGGVVTIDAIPKSASGKILRRDLREVAKNERVRSKL
jgi:4-coumarate--CoA ligase